LQHFNFLQRQVGRSIGGTQMRRICLSFLFITSLFLSACTSIEGTAGTNQSSATEIVGYITKIENQRALVVSSISKEINQSKKEFYDAVWV
jgi:hypothetical protein